MTPHVSSEVVSGPAGTFVGETARLVRWGFRGSAEETAGAVALTVRIDDTFVGLIRAWCFIPGTETSNPESRCSMETEVFAMGTLPEAGAGATTARSGPPVAPALLALACAALIGAGAAVRRPVARCGIRAPRTAKSTSSRSA